MATKRNPIWKIYDQEGNYICWTDDEDEVRDYIERGYTSEVSYEQ